MAMRPLGERFRRRAADRAGGSFWPWANTTAAEEWLPARPVTYLERRIFIVCISFEVALGIVIFKSKTLVVCRAPVGPAG